MSNDPDFSELPKWQYVVENAPIYSLGRITPDNVSIQEWNDGINRKYNYIHGDLEHWDTPAQFEYNGGGHCADFAIYKMYQLIMRSFIPEHLYLAIGQINDGEIHCVLTLDYGDTLIVMSCPGAFPEYMEVADMNSIPGFKTIYIVNHFGYKELNPVPKEITPSV